MIGPPTLTLPAWILGWGGEDHWVFRVGSVICV